MFLGGDCKKGVFCYDTCMLDGFLMTNNMWLWLGILWSMPWKGIALWKSARLSHTRWFVVLFVVNTFGILEIFYIFVIAKKYKVVEVEESK